jgi:hypothetical protein
MQRCHERRAARLQMCTFWPNNTGPFACVCVRFDPLPSSHQPRRRSLVVFLLSPSWLLMTPAGEGAPCPACTTCAGSRVDRLQPAVPRAADRDDWVPRPDFQRCECDHAAPRVSCAMINNHNNSNHHNNTTTTNTKKHPRNNNHGPQKRRRPCARPRGVPRALRDAAVQLPAGHLGFQVRLPRRALRRRQLRRGPLPVRVL